MLHYLCSTLQTWVKFFIVYILDGIAVPIFNFMHIAKLLSKVFEPMNIPAGKEWEDGSSVSFHSL